MHYYGTRLSENISRRDPEGYLLCLNVPVARTGTQDYLPEELGLPPGSFSYNLTVPEGGLGGNCTAVSSGNNVAGQLSNKRKAPQYISVLRPPDEVFSPETIASFEGMPVTNDHPPDGVDIDNIRRLQMGHAHNVRRGTGEESDLLLADLIITDPRLIDAILAGKREISCGYTYELHEESGQYIQRRIRGNHIAVVDAGRAGPRVSIKDEQASKSSIWETPAMLQAFSQPLPVADEGWGNVNCVTARRETRRQNSCDDRNNHTSERSTPMKKSLTKLLARMARDGDVETVAEFIEEMIAEAPAPADPVTEAVAEAVAETVAEAAEAPAVSIETPAGATVTVDQDTLTALVERIDRLLTRLEQQPTADEDPDVPADLPEELAEIVEETLEAVEAEAAETDPADPEPLDASEEISELVASILDPDSGEGEAALVASNDALRANLTSIRPSLAQMPLKKRRKTCYDIAALFAAQSPRGVYAALADARPKPAPDPRELGRRIMAKRNPNYQK